MAIQALLRRTEPGLQLRLIKAYPVSKGDSMEKIKMTTPIVEMDGDEMTRVIWKMIKEELIEPYIDLKSEYYDLGLKERDRTDDEVTSQAANAIKKYGVGVKCATITPNKARVEEYNLKQMYPSPNGTIRAILDGTVFRTPIMVKGFEPYVRTWEKPITIARHAYGDLYKAVEMEVPGPGKAELVFTSEDGKETRKTIKDFEGPGIIQGQHNVLKSIDSFARSCFNYALDMKQDLWFSAKDTISKTYDQTFKLEFQRIYEEEYKEKFEKAGITYFYTLIDDCIARVIKSKGGFIWACKNYDGDVMSDMIATAFGALAMMTSVLVSPQGYYEYEAAHGTVQRHYYKYLKGEETSTNSVATIFAWTGALRKRGQLDNIQGLIDWADKMENAVINTIENGSMTKDLALITTIKDPNVLNTEDFIKAVRATYEGKIPERASRPDMVTSEKSVDELYEDFFDARTFKEKREILMELKNDVTDKMITDFAVSIDVVVDPGPIDSRFLSLMRCLDQMSKFESEGLR